MASNILTFLVSKLSKQKKHKNCQVSQDLRHVYKNLHEENVFNFQGCICSSNFSKVDPQTFFFSKTGLTPFKRPFKWNVLRYLNKGSMSHGMFLDLYIYIILFPSKKVLTRSKVKQQSFFFNQFKSSTCMVYIVLKLICVL